MPTKTPVCDPAKDAGAIAAFSNASQATSSRSSLLRIHSLRFTAGDPKELRVEQIDTGKKAAVPHRRLVAAGGPAIERHLRNRLPCAAQEVPKRVHIVPAREPARDPDHRDRSVDHRSGGVFTLPLSGEIPRSRVDAWPVIEKRRRQASADPVAEFAGQSGERHRSPFRNS